MSSAVDDEDLKMAIAMSLQQSQPTLRPDSPDGNHTIDLTSDVEEEESELRQAIALSLQESERKPREELTEDSKQSAQSLAGFDRKAMEQERLARLGKRKRETPADQQTERRGKARMTETVQSSNTSLSSSTCSGLQYPRGAIKRTFATKYPRTNDITIDELLQASSIHIAVISSFMWDAEWLHKKLDPTRVKQIWIMNAKGRDVQQRWIREMEDCGVPNLKLHFPPMDGVIYNMHSKFMLLFGQEKLRFVVPTANMTQIDWGEVANDWQPGVLENTVFLVDLPRRADGEVGNKAGRTKFGQELVYFLEQQKVAQNVIDGVLKFDFSQTKHLAFVHSM